MDKAHDTKSHSSLRVLHIDDEPMICDVTRLCLERNGKFKVDFVHSAEEALALLKKQSYACIISDYEMPTMNGIELLKEIRSFDSDIPFILFSGRGRETVVIEAINTGADFYIQKGGDAKSLFAELNHKVDYAISKRNARISLKRRDAILEAVSLVATMFLGSDSFENAFSESLALFGLATEVDLVLVFKQEKQDNSKNQYQCISNWSRLGDKKDKKLNDFIAEPTSPVMNTILSGQPASGSAEKFSQEFLGYFAPHLIQSLAIFPVIVDRNVRGMIWFCDCLATREWASIEIDALQAAASIIGSALHHNELRSKLIPGNVQHESTNSMGSQLCDKIPDLLWIKNLDGKYIFANKRASESLLESKPLDSTLCQREKELIPVWEYTEGISKDGQDPGQWESTNSETDSSSNLFYFESETGKRYLSVNTIPLFDQNHESIGTAGYAHDVTEEREREEKYRIEKRKNRSIFYHMLSGMISCLPDGEIIEINPRAADLTGLDRMHAAGLQLHSLPLVGDSVVINDYYRSANFKNEVRGTISSSDTENPAVVLTYQIIPVLDDFDELKEMIIIFDDH